MEKLRPANIIVIFLLVMTVMIPALHARAADTFTMAFFNDPATNPDFKLHELIYREAFRRLGYAFAYRVYPMLRCSVMANTGEVDGEPGRSPQYYEEYPNLIRVAASVRTIKFLAFATNPNIHLDGWESLKGTPYRVEYMLGAVAFERPLSRVVKPELLSTVPTVEQSFKKLIAGRTDISVQTDVLAMGVLQTPEFKDAGIVPVGVMETLDFYPYLHKKHAVLVPKLAEVLTQMKSEGLFEKYHQQAARGN